MAPTKITACVVKDLRFPTSLEKDGSDAVNKEPDYSAGYCILKTDSSLEGHGFTFTCGRGTEIVCTAITALGKLVVGQNLSAIFADFASFWRSLTSEDQMRWLGPEKGIMHLAVAAITNAVWDLWGKVEGKPVWKLLVDMTPEELVNTIDFRYMSDGLSKEEALALLRRMEPGKQERERNILRNGLPCYITSFGWLGYDDDKIRRRCREVMAKGFTRFKAKVGGTLEDDIRRLAIIREEIGPDALLYVDANQKWDVEEAIDWMKKLAQFKLTWIEEPTSPDDILGHAEIARALNPLGIGVATGEHCQNRVMFKQFLKAKALQFCQIDACRLGGVSENVAVILMAKSFGDIPVCPHAGGVGMCELVQRLSVFDYICVSGTFESRWTEYSEHLHDHMVHPVLVRDCKYIVPQSPGYSSEVKATTLEDYVFPVGRVWRKLIADGIHSGQ
ncbi:mitochondrial enolase superfamily member 1-like [Haliotis rubra]|uniref:mitochondrial enolase superfamily member 1-like n=1 Tax=Haliotis rubra TaxID=36100 RepID=UPI001EE58780|nr:mitochondrial enolase superfamily member 1-like [Haliotis rubra]